MVLSQLSIDHSDMKEQLIKLGTRAPDACVSSYIPLVTAGPEVRQNSVRLSNHVKDATAKFEQLGIKPDDARAAVEPLSEIRDELADPTGQRYEGLAVFLSPGFHRLIGVFHPIEERIVSGPRFITRPLLPFVGRRQTVHVLAVSLGQTRVFEITRTSETEVWPEGIPSSLKDLTDFEDPEKSIQQHGQSGATIVHGHGAAKDSGEQLEQNYIAQVAESVDSYLADKDTSLLLATTDEISADFRKRSKHQDIEQVVLTGNVDHLSPAQLRDEAWNLLDEGELNRKQALRDRFEELAGSESDQAVKGVDAALQLAYQGRLNELWFPSDFEAPGRFDAETGKATAQKTDDASVDVDELVDLAAVFTLQNGGEVFVVSADSDEDRQLPRELVGIRRD